MVQSGKKIHLKPQIQITSNYIMLQLMIRVIWLAPDPPPPGHLLTLPSICTGLRGDITMKTWSTTPMTTLHLPWRRRINESKSYLAWHALHIMHSTKCSFHVDTLQNIWDEYLFQSKDWFQQRDFFWDSVDKGFIHGHFPMPWSTRLPSHSPLERNHNVRSTWARRHWTNSPH